MLVEFSLIIVYLPGLRNSVADAFSRQPGEMDQPHDGDIGDSASGLYALQGHVVFAAVEDCLKVEAP